MHGRAHRLRGPRRPRSVATATTVAVIGAGTLGLLDHRRPAPATPTAGTIVATAKHPTQQRLATRARRRRVVEPDELARAVRAATGSFVVGDAAHRRRRRRRRLRRHRATSLTQALAVAAPGGTVIVVGMPGHGTLDLTALWHREIALRGCYAYTRRRLRAPPSTWSASRRPRPAGVGHLPPRRYEEAIEHAANAGRRGAVKIAFDLRDEKERNTALDAPPRVRPRRRPVDAADPVPPRRGLPPRAAARRAQPVIYPAEPLDRARRPRRRHPRRAAQPARRREPLPGAAARRA